MPPKKKKCAPPSSVRQSSENQDDVDLQDESSDSEIDDDPVSRQIGRDAARDTLGPRSRKSRTLGEVSKCHGVVGFEAKFEFV